MTTNLAFSLPASSPRSVGEQENPRRIEIVTSRAQRRARPKLAYALVAIGGLTMIFLAQLLLSIALSNGAYQISSLLIEQRDLGRVEGSLNEQLELVGSTQNLAANAQNLGMVGTSAPAFLRLSDGAVIGAAVAAESATTPSGSIANSLLAEVALVENSAISTEQAPAATADGALDTAALPNSTETDTGTGAPEGSVSSGLTEQGASATPGAEPSVASSPGALPSPVTH
ncbi:hypothetical protein B0I08_104235 [Glaciihabitans tibetensis]|uniref:Cell division protein FtsL n=1 Tax=Glaciihabitans tibetensis TaxID=1266600 RepID=A0A2T0VEC9_9MICO|nr:hypothetical protein [Glaciihabitans tibetensis]PRY68533.1 hypothetical protein B0I08_104235 [Glaciihabitans tibetensis]